MGGRVLTSGLDILSGPLVQGPTCDEISLLPSSPPSLPPAAPLSSSF